MEGGKKLRERGSACRGLESWVACASMLGGRYWRGEKKGGQKERELSGAQQAKA